MNLLHIHSDQHCYRVAGCYGDPVVETPNLDRLAAGGAVFDAAYCPSPICVPSRMAALTGRYPHKNRVWTNQHALDSALPTLAHALGAAGYSPVLSGRMHSVGPDQLHGYVDRLVGDHGPNYLGGTSPDRGDLEGTAGPARISIEHSGSGQSGYEVHDEAVTDAAVEFLEMQEAGSPFALSVGFMLPHPPYVARSGDFNRYRNRVTLPSKNRAYAEEQHPYLRWWRENGGIDKPLSDNEILDARAAYWALVDRMDAMIGRLLDTLDKTGLAEDTLIVYTSDHGDMLGQYGLWWKHVFYEESVRVPLIISWPEGLLPYQRGVRIPNPVGGEDLTATILDLMNAPALPGADGRSFSSLLAGETAGWDDTVFSEYCSDEAFAPDEGTFQRMIRSGKWKYIYIDDAPDQLYDLAEDPEETHSLAEEPAFQDTVHSLRDRVLQGWDPKCIAQRMTEVRSDNRILADWAVETHPGDTCRWPMSGEMNYLD